MAGVSVLAELEAEGVELPLREAAGASTATYRATWSSLAPSAANFAEGVDGTVTATSMVLVQEATRTIVHSPAVTAAQPLVAQVPRSNGGSYITLLRTAN
jgi:hypothetical protein